MLDRDGYRPNVAIVIVNGRNLVFWGKRIREHSWQFPQGGINPGEAPEVAMYRELREEVGLQPQHVRILLAQPTKVDVHRFIGRLRSRDVTLVHEEADSGTGE